MSDHTLDSTELYGKARELMEQARYEDAIAVFRESINQYPHFKSLELLGECLIHLGRHSEAVVPLAASTCLNNGVRAPSLLAEVFLILGDYDRASQIADVALSRNKDNRKAQMVKKAVLDKNPL